MRQRVLHALLENKEQAQLQAVCVVSPHHSLWQSMQAIFSPFFLRELELFVHNNVITVSHTDTGTLHLHCCQQCLKAHALVLAERYGLQDDMRWYFDELFPGETGHDGYYLNQGKLCRV